MFKGCFQTVVKSWLERESKMNCKILFRAQQSDAQCMKNHGLKKNRKWVYSEELEKGYIPKKRGNIMSELEHLELLWWIVMLSPQEEIAAKSCCKPSKHFYCVAARFKPHAPVNQISNAELFESGCWLSCDTMPQDRWFNLWWITE